MYSTKRTNSRCLIAVLIVAIAAWSATSLWGQAIYGSIYGQITDSSGAAIVNATVTVKNVAKGTSVQTTTNAIGEYSVEHLIPDVYDVAVAATGFRGTESQGIRVSADTSPKLDLKLDVGSATETVTRYNRGSPVEDRSGRRRPRPERKDGFGFAKFRSQLRQPRIVDSRNASDGLVAKHCGKSPRQPHRPD